MADPIVRLLWSPFVDSYFVRSVGRRKVRVCCVMCAFARVAKVAALQSWILPMQTISGVLMLLLSTQIDSIVAQGRVVLLTGVFFVLVLLFATQDM